VDGDNASVAALEGAGDTGGDGPGSALLADDQLRVRCAGAAAALRRGCGVHGGGCGDRPAVWPGVGAAGSLPPWRRWWTTSRQPRSRRG